MKNKNIFLVGTVIIATLFVIVVYLVFFKSHFYIPAVFIGKNEIFTDKENLLITNTLQPIITIRHHRELKIEEISLDNRIDLLSKTPLLKGIESSESGGELSIKLPFLISPDSHSINIKAADQKNQKQNYHFSFLLGIKNEFNESIEDSNFFILPEATKKHSPESWAIKNGKLKASSPTTNHASLAFIYSFKNVFSSFQLTPTNKGPLNLVFYFLQNGRSIVIGNGNNSRITMLRGNPYPGTAIEGKPFVMEPDKTYSVFISREQNIYKVYISQESNKERILESDLLLEFADNLLTGDSEDSLGFAIWKGSGGFEIDDLIISSFKPH
jgi:hypothetical protein